MSNYQKGPQGKGAIYIEQKTAANQPDYKGFIILEVPQLQLLMQMAQQGIEPKLQVALWKKRSRANQPYLFAGTEVYPPQQQQPTQQNWNAPPPQQAPQQNWGAPPPQQPQGFRQPPASYPQPPQQAPQQAPQQGGWEGGSWDAGQNAGGDFKDDDIPF